MSRHIAYESLMAELEREIKLADDWKTAHEIANVVKYAPTIDIVRCGECKYWNYEMSGCKRNPSVVAWRDNDFCSYGERSSHE